LMTEKSEIASMRSSRLCVFRRKTAAGAMTGF
jgi:hypothetical protein